MTSYVIGDIQGCYDALQRLLAKIRFSPDKDVLWFVGDLVNRGPDSLKVIQFVQSLKENAITVLGNHDLHMLAVLTDLEKPRPKDTLDEIFNSSHKSQIIDWIRQQALMHVDNDNKYVLTHAGCYPGWTVDEAQSYAKEVEKTLQSDNYIEFLTNMYGNQPAKWDNSLSDWDRLRFITNCFTRMRCVNAELELDLKFKGSPSKTPNGLVPWFELGVELRSPYKILFGHWSTLGYVHNNNVFALDTGCLWGGQLTALALEQEPFVVSVDCKQSLSPH